MQNQTAPGLHTQEVAAEYAPRSEYRSRHQGHLGQRLPDPSCRDGDHKAFHSAALDTHESITYQFNSAGTFEDFCAASPDDWQDRGRQLTLMYLTLSALLDVNDGGK